MPGACISRLTGAASCAASTVNDISSGPPGSETATGARCRRPAFRLMVKRTSFQTWPWNAIAPMRAERSTAGPRSSAQGSGAAEMTGPVAAPVAGAAGSCTPNASSIASMSSWAETSLPLMRRPAWVPSVQSPAISPSWVDSFASLNATEPRSAGMATWPSKRTSVKAGRACVRTGRNLASAGVRKEAAASRPAKRSAFKARLPLRARLPSAAAALPAPAVAWAFRSIGSVARPSGRAGTPNVPARVKGWPAKRPSPVTVAAPPGSFNDSSVLPKVRPAMRWARFALSKRSRVALMIGISPSVGPFCKRVDSTAWWIGGKAISGRRALSFSRAPDLASTLRSNVPATLIVPVADAVVSKAWKPIVVVQGARRPPVGWADACTLKGWLSP